MRPARRPRAALALLLAGALGLSGCTPSPGQQSATARSTHSAGPSAASTAPGGGSQASSGVGSGLAVGGTDPGGLPVVALSSLPRQATTTVRLVQAGGPFPYRQDGVVYHNFNGVLPAERDGYYHEYTVRTPGASNRGARRIIHGQDTEYWYTADHYDSFVRIA